jgi:hypothetical protein
MMQMQDKMLRTTNLGEGREAMFVGMTSLPDLHCIALHCIVLL